MRNATHQEAVAALIANVSLIKLLVRHDPPPKGLQVSAIDVSFVILALFHRHIPMETLFRFQKVLFFPCLSVVFLFINPCLVKRIWSVLPSSRLNFISRKSNHLNVFAFKYSLITF